MGKAVLRFVQETDAAQILEIYTPYIRDTAVTFECEVPSLAAFTQRIREFKRPVPVSRLRDRWPARWLCLCAPAKGAGCIWLERGAVGVSKAGLFTHGGLAKRFIRR